MAYYKVLTDTAGQKSLDERSSSIELAFTEAIAINSDNVMGVLMPEAFADDPYFGEKIRSLNIDIRTYRFTPKFSSNEHISRIYDADESYYQSKGLLP